MKKDIKFSTRMASADREAIKELAKRSGMSMSDYVTACCLGKQVVVIDGLKEVLKELKSIGRNLKCIGALHLTVFRDFGAFPLGILWEVRPILSIVFVRSFPRVGHGVGHADASASKKPRTGFAVIFRFAISLS